MRFVFGGQQVICAIVGVAICSARSGTAAEVAKPGGPAPIVIGAPATASRVPDPWRQSVFVDLQNVSAIDISPDGTRIGVATMAFRNDRNFWLLSDSGEVLWGRHVDPWAPQQTAVLAGGKTCGIALAYTRVMQPTPTISIFQGEQGNERLLVDAFWDMGWLRYGSGDWRTGWPVSMLGDMMVRAGDSLITVSSHDGALLIANDGAILPFPLPSQRPFRMAASADGRVVALGYLSPDVRTLDEKTRARLSLPPAMLVARNTSPAEQLWTLAADHETATVPKPPEATDDYPELSAEFNIKPLALVPFRAPLSVALDAKGRTTAAAEYGGWLRVKRERAIGSWNPDHSVFYCPRQRGTLRVVGAGGETVAQAEFPTGGSFEVRLDAEGTTVWCAPQAWFARGLAGRSWLPADPRANSVLMFDLASQRWLAPWQFPDEVSDLALAPDGQQVLVSCWNGTTYLLDRAGTVRASVDVGDAARLSWSADGRFAVAGTQHGDVWCLDAGGQVRWHTALSAAEVPPLAEVAKPVLPGVPIYSLGRLGKEEAYVGDMWLIKAPQDALLVDCAGTSAIPLSWQRMKAAGVEPEQLRYLLLTHSHGDHMGGAYLWRTLGAKIVAPETAALAVGWLTPTWSDYGIWPPTLIDVPLPLKQIGDETEFTLSGLKIKAIFVPGHSPDSVIYVMDFGDKRVAFTGDIGFQGETHILHRTWGDLLKARAVVQVLREKVLPLRPDYVITGHQVFASGMEFLESLVERTEAALQSKR